jgi:hypothetical protein
VYLAGQQRRGSGCGGRLVAHRESQTIPNQPGKARPHGGVRYHVFAAFPGRVVHEHPTAQIHSDSAGE